MLTIVHSSLAEPLYEKLASAVHVDHFR